MDDLEQKSVLCFDYGDGIPLARRLAREFGTVKIFCPWKDKYPQSVKLAVGTGFPDVQRVRNFSDAINTTDLFVFTDIYDGDLQRDLVNRGKRVWGARKGEELEYDRALFLQTVQKVGLPVPEYEICYGLDELEAFLRKHDDQWVKVNLRGDDETWHHKSWEFTQRKFEFLRYRYGPIGNDLVFTVVANIDSVIEAAYDGFLITSPDGKPQFPQIGFLGYEDKNNAHILTAIPYDAFPEVVRTVNDAFAPEVARYFSRCGFGTEIKVVRDKKTDEEIGHFLDLTLRQPSPPGEVIQELVKNLGRFFWEGSQGNIIPLEVDELFGVQVNIYSSRSKTNHSVIKFPEQYDSFIKLFRCCMRDGDVHLLPDKPVSDEFDLSENCGSVVATSNSIEDAIDIAKEICDSIEGDGLTFKTDALAECLKRIQKGEDQNIPFAEDVPEPATVIED